MPSQRRPDLCGSIFEKDSAAVGGVRAHVLCEMWFGEWGWSSGGDGGEWVEWI